MTPRLLRSAIALALLASACAPSAPAPSTEPPSTKAATQPLAAPEPTAPTAPTAQADPAAICGNAECAQQPLPNALTAGTAQTFGEAFTTDPAHDVDIADLIATPDRFGSDPLTVRGEVTAVCQMRGCWLEVAAKGAEQGCRITSEHHDWLVPRDSIGATARVRGRVQVRTIPAAQVAHMEAEGGHFPAKQPDGTARELRLIASGVALTRLANP